MSHRGGVFPLFLSLTWHWYQRHPALLPGESPGTGREELGVLGLLFSGWSGAWCPQVTDTRAHAPCPALCEGRGAQSLWGHSSRSVLLTSASIMVRIPQLQPLAGVTETSISILHYAMHWGFMFSCLLGIFFPDGQWSPKARNKAFSVFWVYYIF